MSFKPPGQCPVCGEWVPRVAVACDDCGSCAKTGWKENSEVYDGLDLYDEEEFNYDEFVQKEFGSSNKKKGFSKETFWRWVAAIVLAVMVWYLMSIF